MSARSAGTVLTGLALLAAAGCATASGDAPDPPAGAGLEPGNPLMRAASLRDSAPES